MAPLFKVLQLAAVLSVVCGRPTGDELKVSTLDEDAAQKQAARIMKDCETMKLKFGGEDFSLVGLDRDVLEHAGIILGQNALGDKISIYLTIDNHETPEKGMSEIEVVRVNGLDDIYLSVGHINVKIQGNFFNVTGEYFHIDEPVAKKHHKLDLYYGISLGLKGSTILKVNPNNESEALLEGGLGAQLFFDLPDFAKGHPIVKTIVMTDIPGSDADRFNTLAGLRLRRLGFDTKILKNSQIYSGGVDLFASGVRRFAEIGAKVGVHAWCCDEEGKEAWQIPWSDSKHQPYVNYLSHMLGSQRGKSFYYHTINSAKAHGIHLMSADEMKHFGLVTDRVQT